MLRAIAPITQWVSIKVRRRVAYLVAWVVAYCVMAGPAQAAIGSKTSPDGLGGLFTIPNLRKGEAPLLLEAYSPQRYTLYQDFGWDDIVGKVSYPIYQALTELSYAIVKLAVGLTWWLNDMTTYDTGTNSMADGVQSMAGALQGWLLPSAIAVGALIAYARARGGTEDVLGQLLSIALVVLSVIALSQSAREIIGGLDRGRVVLGQTVNSLGASAIGQQNEPFKFSKDPELKADTPNAVARKSGDVVWRTFFVTPWCQANFGSQAACKQYADGWLAQPDFDARKKYLNSHIADAEGGSDSSTVKYMKGSAPGTRIGVSIFGLAIAIGGSVVIGGMAFFALLPWLLALVLMFLAVFFLCLMVIPGRTRQLGSDYLQSILGLTLFSALTGGLLSGMLLLMIQASKISGDKGWLASMLLMVGALGAGWEARKLLNRMVTGSTSGGIGGLMGGLAMARMSGRMAGGIGKRLSRSVSGSGGSGGGSRPQLPSKAGSRAGSPGEGLAYRSGQFAGALRHPRVAGGKGMSATGQFFQARAHAATSAVKGRAAGIGAAAGRGFSSTGRRSSGTGDPATTDATATTATSTTSGSTTTRSGGQSPQTNGDRGSTARNGTPRRVNSKPRRTRHPAGAYASRWQAEQAPSTTTTGQTRQPAPSSPQPRSRPQPAYATVPSSPAGDSGGGSESQSQAPAATPAARPQRTTAPRPKGTRKETRDTSAPQPPTKPAAKPAPKPRPTRGGDEK